MVADINFLIQFRKPDLSSSPFISKRRIRFIVYNVINVHVSDTSLFYILHHIMILLIAAIQGRILQQGIINNANTVTRVEVLKVLKESKVQVRVNSTVDLWTNSTCVCPRLIRNRTYLLIGYEDTVTQRLLFLDNCLAAQWKKKWVKRLKVSYRTFCFCDCCYIVSSHDLNYANRIYLKYNDMWRQFVSQHSQFHTLNSHH